MASSGVGRPLFSRYASCLVQQRRNFTSTPRYLKDPVPVFQPTSSPQLDGLLNKFRESVFIPDSLGPIHRNLIYKKSKAQQLRDHPIIINVHSKSKEVEKYQLRYMELSEKPTKKEFKNIFRLMKTQTDWQNLIPFLIGMNSSRRHLSEANLERIIRKAGHAGMEGVVLEGAKQGRRTGLSLRNKTLAHALLFAIRHKAQQADFKGPDVEAALKKMKQAAVLMNAPEHTNELAKEDPKRLPTIIGPLLELNAAQALDSFKGKDQLGEVRATAEKVLGTWALGDFETPDKWPAANLKLFELVPLWHGMDLALRVAEIKDDKALTESLEERMAELGKHIDIAVEKVTKEASVPNPAGVKLSKDIKNR